MVLRFELLLGQASIDIDAATAKMNLGLASKNRKQEPAGTAPTDLWEADFAFKRTELAQNIGSLCLSCQSLLIRPTCDPNSQKGPRLSDPLWIIRRPLCEALSAAMTGCIICKLLMAAHATFSQHSTNVDLLDGFKLGLFWSGSRFSRIDVIPIDQTDRAFTFQDHLNGIRLVLEDGIVLILYYLTLVKIIMSSRPRE